MIQDGFRQAGREVDGTTRPIRQTQDPHTCRSTWHNAAHSVVGPGRGAAQAQNSPTYREAELQRAPKNPLLSRLSTESRSTPDRWVLSAPPRVRLR